jgi:hypothetical protein
MPTMRTVVSLMLVMLLAACGGGGGQATSSVPTIRFEGVYTSGATTTLTIGPVADAATIGNNAVARVDVLVNDQWTLSLAASSRVDAAGRDEYVFDIPPVAGEAGRLCSTNLPLRVTVTDVTGFSFSKYATVCPTAPYTFSAFSDYGDRDVHITAASSAPMDAVVARYQEVGDYHDDVIRKSATSLDVVLRSNERDSLTARIGNFSVDPVPAPSVPAGSTMTTRVDAGGGAFAEASGIVDVAGQAVDVALACCHATADGSAKQVRILVTGVRSANAPSFSYTWRVTDPATGAVVSQDSGTQSGATLAKLEQVLDVRSGQQVDVTATSLQDPPTLVNVLVLAAATSGLVLGSADTNGQAHVSVFCCSLYPSP